ncbi:MAG: MerR family transcriptional regulator [Planctomycetes bacterium]|nr:MerR family transcriptional regulator [Planctomycetota bacterium]
MKEDTDPMLDPVIPIGVVAEKVGLSVSAIRKYETEGLIIPHRTPTGRRMYSLEDIERVRAIQHMIQGLGLNMEGIRRLLAMLPCWRLSSLRPRERDACPAFNDTAKPCWMSDSPKCAPEKDKCRICPVYRYGTQHTEHIKRLVFSQTDDEAVRAFRALVDQAGVSEEKK